MGTGGINPIQYGLTEVGRSFRGLLDDEARRRDQALQAQQETNKLSLQQALYANQARAQESQGQVQLAEVATRGRLQERQAEAEQQRIGIARDTLTATTDYNTRSLQQQGQYQQGQLEIGRTNAQTQQAQARETQRHAQAMEGIQGPYYRALAANATTEGRLRGLQAEDAERKVKEGATAVQPAAVLGAFHQLWSQTGGKEYADTLLNFTQTYLSATHPDVSALPKDAQGNPLFPHSTVQSVVAVTEPIGKAMLEHRLKKAIPVDQQLKIITESFGKLSDLEQQKGLPAYALQVLPFFQDFQTYTAAMHALEGTLDTVRQAEEAQYRQQARLKPNAPIPPAEYKTKIQPGIDAARERGQRQIQVQILQGQGIDLEALLRSGTPPPSPAGTPGPPAAPASLPAAANTPARSLVNREFEAAFRAPAPASVPQLEQGVARYTSRGALATPAAGAPAPVPAPVAGGEGAFPPGTVAYVQRALTARLGGAIPDGTYPWQFPGSPDPYVATVQGGRVIALAPAPR